MKRRRPRPCKMPRMQRYIQCNEKCRYFITKSSNIRIFEFVFCQITHCFHIFFYFVDEILKCACGRSCDAFSNFSVASGSSRSTKRSSAPEWLARFLVSALCLLHITAARRLTSRRALAIASFSFSNRFNLYLFLFSFGSLFGNEILFRFCVCCVGVLLFF